MEDGDKVTAAGPWISVQERLPNDGELVLLRIVRDGIQTWDAGGIYCGVWYVSSDAGNVGRVTHWAEVRV